MKESQSVCTRPTFATQAIFLFLGFLLAGVWTARADILGATNVDFSNAAQGTAGFEYGYYTGTNATAEGAGVSFSTSGMNPAGLYSWEGTAGSNTPSHNPFIGLHPGVNGSSVVRRYTVGDANGEPAHTGPVRIVGSFWDLNSGQTSGFITVDGVVVFPRTAVNGPLPFDFAATVAPGSKIDFGATIDGDNGFSDQTGLVAWIVTGDTAVPTGLVANAYNSAHEYNGAGEKNVRHTCFAMVSDGKVSGVDETSFDTLPGTGHPFQFAGLLYLENAGSGKATRFDSVRIDVTTGADFAEQPSLYLRRHNSDPGSTQPADDYGYVRLPVVAVRNSANSAGQPYYTFDLTSLPAAERTGYGFAVVGRGIYSNGAIAVSEISANAVRVADTGMTTTEPAWIEYGGHRYVLTSTRGTWEQCEAEAVSYGGHLVAINNTAENDFIARAFGTSEAFFIGLKQNVSSPSYAEPAGGFEWVNGDAVTFTNWNPGEPNNHFGAGEDYVLAAGAWGDVRNVGFPENGGYFRGIIELPTTGGSTELRHHRVIVSAQANIFGAGQVDPTPCVNAGTGGVPALSVPAFGGEVVTISGAIGYIFTGAENAGPEGVRNPPRICDITGVAGVSGYLNRSTTASLVGVFVGDTPLSQTPARIDFSADALGENFAALAPGLGQVFFIGDGFTSGNAAQQFVAPAGATRFFVGIPDAYSGDGSLVYTGPPNAYADNTGSFTVRVAVEAGAAPVITETEFPALDPVTRTGQFGMPAGGTGPYNWEILSGDFPPHLILNPDGSIILSGHPEVNGDYTFIVRVNDVNGVPGDKQFTISIHNAVPPPGGLVAWWPGDDAVAEIIGGHHGSLKNRPNPASSPDDQTFAFGGGKVGRGFFFDGTNDLVEVADADALDITGDLTIEAWVNATATSGERTIIGKRSADNNDVTYVLFLRDGIPLFSSRNAGGSFREASAGVVLPAGLNHVAVTIAGSTLKIFINGSVLLETSTYDGVRPATDGPVTIGGTITAANPVGSPDGCFGGVIDELTLYDFALPNAAIAAIHGAGAGGKARYDAAREFSTAENPNGVWTYGWLPAGPLNVNQFAELAGAPPRESGIDSWSGPSYITLNPNDTWVVISSGGTQYDWAPLQMGMGPSPNSDYAVLRWTAPAAGRYAVSANFLGADPRPTSVDVWLYHKATKLFGDEPGSFLNSYRGDGVPVTRTIIAQAGDSVDFILGAHGDFFYDSSAIFASVVPLGTAFQIEQLEFPDIGDQLTAAGGTGAVTFSVQGGAENLPPGITLAADGTVGGTPTTAGTFTFTIIAEDGAGQTASAQFTVTIAFPIPAPAGLLSWFPGEWHGFDIMTAHEAKRAMTAAFAEGKVGRTFHFDGVTDGLATATTLNSMKRVPLTIEAWVRPELRNDGTDFPTNAVSSDKQNHSGHGFGVNVFPGGSQLKVEYEDGFRVVPGVSFTAGEWYHVAVVYSQGNVKTYVDGELMDDHSFTQAQLDGETVIRIGKHNDDTGIGTRRFFKGDIDEVSIYSGALAAATIESIYLAGDRGKLRYDAATDFSTTQDAHSRWQYGMLDPLAMPFYTTFERYPALLSIPQLRHWTNFGVTDPNVIKNVTDGQYGPWGPGALSLHPGPGSEYSAVRWTAPETGTYAVFAQYRPLNSPTTTTLHLLRGISDLVNDFLSTANQGAVTYPENPGGGNTISLQAGDTLDFVVGQREGFGNDTTGLLASIVPLAQLQAPTHFTIDTELPTQVGKIWTFRARIADGFPGLGIRIQHTSTPDNESSWTDLRIAGQIAYLFPPVGADTDWTLEASPLVLPEGNYFFRVVASADGFQPKSGPGAGKEVLVGGDGEPGAIYIAPAAALTQATGLEISTKNPPSSGRRWKFTANRAKDVPGLRLRVQFSASPGDEASWKDLPGDSYMIAPTKKGSTVWSLEVARLNLPPGNYFFRVLSTAPGAPDQPSAVFGANAIRSTNSSSTAIAVANPQNMILDPEAEVRGDNDNLVVFNGEEFIYHIDYETNGAQNVIVSVMFPADVEFVGADFGPLGENNRTLLRKKQSEPNSPVIGVKWVVGTPVIQGFQRLNAMVRVKATAKLLKQLTGTCTIESVDRGKVTADLPKLVVAPPIGISVDRKDGQLTPLPKGGLIELNVEARNYAAFDIGSTEAVVDLPVGTFFEFAETPLDLVTGQVPPATGNGSNPQIIRDPKTRKPTHVKWFLGRIPAGQRQVMTLKVRSQYDWPGQFIHVGNPDKNDSGVLFTATKLGGTEKFTIGAQQFAYSVQLLPVVIDPPQLSLNKEVYGETEVDGTITGPNGERVRHRAAAVRSEGEILYFFTVRNDGRGTAHNVVLKDAIPSGTTFISNSMLLNGQPFTSVSQTRLFRGAKEIAIVDEPLTRDLNGNGKYEPKKDGTGDLFNDHNGDGDRDLAGDLTKVKNMEFHLGELDPGDVVAIQYAVRAPVLKSTAKNPLPILADTASILTDSLFEEVRGTNLNPIAYVVKGIELKLDPPKADVPVVRPGQDYKYLIRYQNVGHLPGKNCYMDVPIPAGTTFRFAYFADPDTEVARGFGSGEHAGEDLPPPTPGATGTVRFKLGELTGGERGMVVIGLNVSTPLHASLLATHQVVLEPKMGGYDIDGSNVGALHTTARFAARTPAPKLVDETTSGAGTPVLEPADPKLFVGRAAPLSVHKGKRMIYTIYYGNLGDGAATSTSVGMQIPYGTRFIEATQATTTHPGSAADINSADVKFTTNFRLENSKHRRKVDGPVNLIFWDIGNLPGHSAGAMRVTVEVDPNFPNAAAEDNSCSIKATNSAEKVAGLISTQVRSENQFFAFWESFGAALNSFGSWLSGAAKDKLAQDIKTLTNDSQTFVLGGLDTFQLQNGALVTSLGFNRALAIGPSQMVAAGGLNLVAAGAGNLVAAGGGNMVAAGAGNLIGINDVPGRGHMKANAIIPAIPSLVAAGGGNMVAAGGLNLIGLDGGSLIGLDGGSLGTFNISQFQVQFTAAAGSGLRDLTFARDPSKMVAAGGLNLVAAGGGNLVAAGGGNIRTDSAGQLVAAGGLNMVAAGGGNIVAAGGGNMVAAGAGNIVAAGGLN